MEKRPGTRPFLNNTDIDVNIIELLTRRISSLELEIKLRRDRKHGATKLKQGRITTGSGDANHTLLGQEYDKTIVEVSGIVTPGRNVIFPMIDSAIWLFVNLNPVAVTCIMVGTAGPGVTVAANKTAWIYCNGADILRAAPDA